MFSPAQAEGRKTKASAKVNKIGTNRKMVALFAEAILVVICQAPCSYSSPNKRL
jgi:hypothetical protein